MRKNRCDERNPYKIQPLDHFRPFFTRIPADPRPGVDRRALGPGGVPDHLETLQGIAWMLVFFVVALVAYVIVRIFESRKAGSQAPSASSAIPGPAATGQI